jgi:hypothetical protein
MAVQSAVAVQIVRLLQQQPPAIWELIETSEPARKGDVILYDGNGAPVTYARPLVSTARV